MLVRQRNYGFNSQIVETRHRFIDFSWRTTIHRVVWKDSQISNQSSVQMLLRADAFFIKKNFKWHGWAICLTLVELKLFYIPSSPLCSLLLRISSVCQKYRCQTPRVCLIPNTIWELLANYCNSWSLHLPSTAPSKARYTLPEAVTAGHLLTQILPTSLWRKCLYGTPMGGYGYLYFWALFDSEPVTDRILNMLPIFLNVKITKSL